MSYFTLKEAVEGVCKAESALAMFGVLQEIFGLYNDIDKSIHDLEKMEFIKEIYANPDASMLDLFDAQRERISASGDANAEFLRNPQNKKLVGREGAITYEGIKKDLIAIGTEGLPLLEEDLSAVSEVSAELQRCKDRWNEYSTAKGRWISSATEKEINDNADIKELGDALKQINKDMETAWAAFPASYTDQDPSSKLRYEEIMSPLREKKSNIYEKRSEICDRIHTKLRSEAEALFDEKISSIKEEYNQAQQKKIKREEAIFLSIINSLISQNSPSEEQAASWAENNVFIAENAEKKLRRLGYHPDQLKKDVAELYRYVGGKIGPVEFVLEGHSKRAFARGKSLVSIQGNFNKPTMFHECGHLVEHWDPAFGVACGDFIKHRATGAPVKLKVLTGLRYGAQEKAYPDSFVDPYVGKIYGSGSTEVISMGLQSLSSPQALTQLAQKDPEHLKLILGVCKRSNPFLKDRLEEASAIAAAKVSTQTRFEVWQKALGKVSGPALGKLLDKRNGGYKGFKIEVYGRAGSLFPVVLSGEISWITSIHMGKIAELRAVAYLLIAHAEGLLFQDMNAEEAQRQIVLLIRQNKIPEWFNPEIPLPKV